LDRAKEEGKQAKGRSQAHRSRTRQIAGYGPIAESGTRAVRDDTR